MEVFEVSQSGRTTAASSEDTEVNGGQLTDRAKLRDPMTMEDSSVPFLAPAEAAVETVRRKHTKPLSLLPLVALIFYDVSGGPFGTEVASTLAVHFATAMCFRKSLL